MANTYVLDWSNASKGTITVPPNTTNATSTSLKLFGEGTVNYGEMQQENFIRLLENFSSDISPANPTSGQLWYDTTNQKLKVFNGTVWVLAGGTTASATAPTGPSPGDLWYNLVDGKLYIYDGVTWQLVWPQPTGEQVKVAYLDEYNSMVTTYNLITSTPVGSTLAAAYGYNQIPLLTKTSLTNQDWLTFLGKITNLANHQGVNTSSINTTGFIYESGNTISKGIVSLIPEYQLTLSTLNSMATMGRFYAAPTSLESQASAAGTRVRATLWNGTITNNILMSFPDVNTAKAYFNSGGKLQFNTTIPNSPATSVNNDWNNLMTNLGTVIFGALGTTSSTNGSLGTTSKGFYDLTTTYTTVATRTTAGVYATGTYTIQLRLENGGRDIRALITLTSGGTVTATTTSALTMVKANNTFVNNPVIPYPTVTSSGTM